MKSNRELEIHERGVIWSDIGVMRPLTLHYEGKITSVRVPTQGEKRGPNPDIRVYFRLDPIL